MTFRERELLNDMAFARDNADLINVERNAVRAALKDVDDLAALLDNYADTCEHDEPCALCDEAMMLLARVRGRRTPGGRGGGEGGEIAGLFYETS